MEQHTFRRLSWLRPARLVAISLVSGVALAACGSDGGSTVAIKPPESIAAKPAVTKPAGPTPSAVTAQALLADAPAKAVAAGTAKFSLSVNGTADGKPVVLTAGGAFDFAHPALQMTFDASGLAPSAVVPSGGLQAEARIVDLVAYVRTAALDTITGPTGKPWVKIDLRTAASGAGLDPSLSATIGQSAPDVIAALTAVSKDVTEVGKEDVRGTPTTHYRATLDLSKAVTQVPADLRSKLEAQTGESLSATLDKLSTEYGVTAVPADVWVDGTGLLRRISLSVAPTGAGSAQLSLDLYDYGSPVDVQAPPADQVFDLTALASLAGGLSSTTPSAAH